MGGGGKLPTFLTARLETYYNFLILKVARGGQTMKFATEFLAEKPSPELEKQIAVSVFEGTGTAKRAISSRFSDAGVRESSCGDALRGEEAGENEAEPRTARIIPPPPVSVRNMRGLSRVPGPGFPPRPDPGRGSFVFPVRCFRTE